MKLQTRLDMALKGISENDPAAVFTYVWNCVGIPIKEEDVRRVIPISESSITNQDVDDVINYLKSQFRGDDWAEATHKDIMHILREMGFKGEPLEKLTKIIMDRLSYFREPPEIRWSKSNEKDPFAELKKFEIDDTKPAKDDRSKSKIESGDTVAMRKHDDEDSEDWDSKAVEYGESEVISPGPGKETLRQRMEAARKILKRKR